MKMLRLSSCHSPSVTQMAARKQVRKHLRRIREREYSKLRALVPAVATKKRVTKVQVIEEAVRYIEELHTALVERFRQKHGCGAESMAQETVRSFVNQMMPPARPAGSSSSSSSHHHNNNPITSSSHPHHPHPPAAAPALNSHPHPHHSLPLLPAPHPHGASGGAILPFLLPPCPVPAFLSAPVSSSFEKQRKRASFLLKRTRRDC